MEGKSSLDTPNVTTVTLPYAFEYGEDVTMTRKRLVVTVMHRRGSLREQRRSPLPHHQQQHLQQRRPDETDADRHRDRRGLRELQ